MMDNHDQPLVAHSCPQAIGQPKRQVAHKLHRPYYYFFLSVQKISFSLPLNFFSTINLPFFFRRYHDLVVSQTFPHPACGSALATTRSARLPGQESRLDSGNVMTAAFNHGK